MPERSFCRFVAIKSLGASRASFLRGGDAELDRTESDLLTRLGDGDSRRVRFDGGDRLRLAGALQVSALGDGDRRRRGGERDLRRFRPLLRPSLIRSVGGAGEEDCSLLVFRLLRRGGVREDELLRLPRFAGGDREAFDAGPYDGERRRLPVLDGM